MDHQESNRIIRALADGKNPFTGETLPPESIFQHADIFRALVAAGQALEKIEEQHRRRRHLPAKAGMPWSKEEDESLLCSFEKGISTKLLAAEHNRSVFAIHSRLVLLGKIKEGDTVDGLIVIRPKFEQRV